MIVNNTQCRIMDKEEIDNENQPHRYSHASSSSFLDDDDEDANAGDGGDHHSHGCTATSTTPTRPTNTTGDSESNSSVLPSRKIPSISQLKHLIMMWKNVDGNSAPDAVESVPVMIRNLETLLEYLEKAAANDNTTDESDTIGSKEMTTRLLLLNQGEDICETPGQQQKQQHDHEHYHQSQQEQQHHQQRPRQQNLSRENSDVNMSLESNEDVTSPELATETATKAAGTRSPGNDTYDDDEDDTSMSASHDRLGEEDNNANNSNEDRRKTVQCQPSNNIATSAFEEEEENDNEIQAAPYRSEESSQNNAAMEESSQQQQQQQDSSSQQPYYESQQLSTTTWEYSKSFPSPWDSQFDYNNDANKNSKSTGDDGQDQNDGDKDDDDENEGIGSSIDSQFLPQSCDFGLLGRGWDKLPPQSSSQGQNGDLNDDKKDDDNDDDSSSSSSSSKEEALETKESTEIAMDDDIPESTYKNDKEKILIDKPPNSDRQVEINSPPISEPFHERFTPPAKHVSTRHAECSKKNPELTPIFKDSAGHYLRNITPYSTMTTGSTEKSIASYDATTTEQMVLPCIICDTSVTNGERDRLRSLEHNGRLSILHEAEIQQRFDASSSSSLPRSGHITRHKEDYDMTAQSLDNKSDEIVLFVQTKKRPSLSSSTSEGDRSIKSVFVCERTFLYYLCRAMGCLVVSSDVISDLENQRRGGQTIVDFHDLVMRYQVWGDNGLYEQMIKTSNTVWPTQFRDSSILSTTRLSSSLHNMLAGFNVLVVNADVTDDIDEEYPLISSLDEDILISQEDDDRLCSGPTKDQIEYLCKLLGANIVQNITDQSEIDYVKASTRRDTKTIVLISPTVENVSSLIHSLTTEQMILPESWKRNFVTSIEAVDTNIDSHIHYDQQGFHCPSSIPFLYNLWVMDAISAGCLPPMNYYAIGHVKR